MSMDSEGSVVTPHHVEGEIDYVGVMKKFGVDGIDAGLRERFERVIGVALHPWIRRGIFFSHRDLSRFLDAFENGEPVYLYTGRGPSSESMHLGHLIPFMLTKWLQDVFDCVVIVQIADDEKYYFKSLEFADVYRLGFENAKDIIACGFNVKKTFIFSNRNYRLNVAVFEELVSAMKKYVSAREVAKIFGFGEKIEVTNKDLSVTEYFVFDEKTNVGMMDWPFYQAAASFSQSFPHIFGGVRATCLVAYAIDQDPYFRLGRDLAGKMNLAKSCSIISEFLCPLSGSAGKMSSSAGGDSTLFLTDEPGLLREKILKHAFSGGGGDGSLSDHKKFGGNLKTDVSYQYLRYFEFDDTRLDAIKNGFSKGEMTCSQIKGIMADKIIELFCAFQAKRKAVSDVQLGEFYDLKPIVLPIQKKIITTGEAALYKKLDDLEIKFQTLYHPPMTTVSDTADITTKLSGTLCKVLLLQGPAKHYYLYITNIDTVVNMKTLHKRLAIAKINYATRDMLQELLKVPIGCATIFGVMNYEGDSLDVVLDDTIPKTKPVSFYPLRNDASTTISYPDLLKFLDHYDYVPKYVITRSSATC